MIRWFGVFAGFVVFGVLAACGGGHGHADASNGDGAHDGTGTGDGDGALVDADPACANPGSIPALHAQQVVAALTQPVFVTQPPGSTDLYVVEKPGRIVIIRAGAVLATPFLDISAEIYLPFAQTENGLLGLAFKADYVTTGRFFIYANLAASGPDPNRIAIREYHRSAANPDVADAAPVAELLAAPTSAGNEVGGTVAFGPDGKLWAATGDASTTPSDAQVLSSRLGKMLRIDVDNPSVAPADNLGGAADAYVWDYGLRNPYRFSFDRQTGEVYIADAGDHTFEEVNIEPPATGHRDYGWDRIEGTHCVDGTTTCAPGTPPTFERPYDNAFSVIIGGNVYRGAAMPCLRGRYLFGIFGTGHVLSWVWTGAQVTSQAELTNMLNVDVTNIVGFGEDRAGELYFVTIDGYLYEIVPG